MHRRDRQADTYAQINRWFERLFNEGYRPLSLYREARELHGL